MTPTRFRLACGAAALVSAGLLAAGCSDSSQQASPGDPAPAAVTIEISDSGCGPRPAIVPSGPVNFAVTNAASVKVTEAEIQSGGKILGEKENITAGLDGAFSLRMEPGTYSVYCPGAAKDTWTFTVDGTGGAAPTATAETSLTAATQGYHDYVVSEVAQLQTATRTFTDAVRAGNADAAKKAFAPARVHYESIEPVAESFGDLDPAIDARIDDVADPAQWTGFHRIEKALWADNSLAGMVPIADKLDADVATVKDKAGTDTYQPAELANGASDLLTEVSTSKVTGEEDRYSHTDLWDFAANIDGARKAFELLRPALAAKDPDLAQQLEARFTDVTQGLAKYRTTDGGYQDYSAVTDTDKRSLADSVNALAEPLSQIAGKVV
ncbi:iron uptake system protein EfeO [Pseudonocardia sp. N23]|uniref:iron uptake system protein EfeO n=1 Tax=Pseudonocardia sp. N23 TaxID=1987376 RepID=UPI000BFDCF32|nr:iron uptake system protein EfeO [Pseudonocardia sp. N23]GAY12637.1 ferrous iron transport periplasmic protein EfeO [Pseudonocardia sp. N23]